jgi:CheY-like chemotaxis protein/two-component sensor histidine kinase
MTDLDEEQLRAVDHIQRAGGHLLDLIDEVLDLARIEAGDMRLDLEPLEVASIVGEAIELMRPVASGRRIDVEFDPNRNPGLVARGDRKRLLQVLLNVISNAVKYNVEGGRVDVVIGTSPTEVRIEVQDTGPGLTSDELRRAFVPFDRLGAEKRGIEGTGMGLPLAQSMIEAMAGRIEAWSEPGRGSTFSILLPRADQESHRAATELTGNDARPPSGAIVVLYVEDNLASLELMHAACRQRPDITLRTAGAGRSGLHSAIEDPPDIIVLDLHLPDMPGEEVLTELRAHPRTATIPIVVVSADVTPSRIDQLLALGTDAYLTKPIDLNHLFAVLDDLGRRTSR